MGKMVYRQKEISHYDLSGTVEECIQSLRKIVAETGKSEAVVDIDFSAYNYSGDAVCDIQLSWEEEETEEQRVVREAAEAKHNEYVKKAELKKLAELKAKYESK